MSATNSFNGRSTPRNDAVASIGTSSLKLGDTSRVASENSIFALF
jgi:hypothetical protein